MLDKEIELPATLTVIAIDDTIDSSIDWYGAITERGGDNITGRVDQWQSSVASFLQEQGAVRLAVVFAMVIGAALFIARRRGTAD